MIDIKEKILSLKPDILSGLSTATIVLPKTIAYAIILGINPIYGIYASIYSLIIATIFNHSKLMIVGPTNMMAVALASSLRSFQGDQYLEYIFLTTFLIGFFQFVLVKLKLSELIKYVSQPVIVGLSHGVAILIFFSQLENFTGISVRGQNVIMKSINFIRNFNQINYLSLGVGISTLLIIFVISKFKPNWPEYLLTIIIIIVITYFTNIYSQISIIGNIPSQIVNFNVISFDLSMIKDVYTSAFSLALLGLIQTMAVLEAISRKTKNSIDFEKDFTSQGLTNMGVSFFSGFAIAASFSNTFANMDAGAKSQKSQLFCAFSIIIFILFLRPILSFVPIAAMASLVIWAASNIINTAEVKKILSSTKGDIIMLASTFFATIILPYLDQAILLGISVSLIVVIKASVTTDIHLLYSPNAFKDEKINLKRAKTDDSSIDIDSCDTCIINIKGALLFSTVDYLRAELESYFEPEMNFIIRLRNTSQIDLTIIEEFIDFIKKVQDNNGIIMFAGVSEETIKLFNQLGLTDILGEENIFKKEKEFLESTHKAILFLEEKYSEENKKI